MTGFWLRRAALMAACACAALLAACGSSTIESQLQPSRVVSFGDALSDVGAARFTAKLNDGKLSIVSEQVASSYGHALTPASAGGLGFAQGNARITIKPDAAGNSATRTVVEQIDAFLAASSLGANDLVLINGGISDIVAGMAANPATVVATAQQAGRDLATQVRRLVAAGAKHVAVLSVYNLGKSPWAATTDASLLSNASRQFNDTLKLALLDLGDTVLYVDIEGHVNLVTASPTTYLGTGGTATGFVCTLTDPGNGIGIGTNEVNSALCDSTNLATGLDPAKHVFADKLYFTPVVNRLVGTFAFGQIHARW